MTYFFRVALRGRMAKEKQRLTAFNRKLGPLNIRADLASSDEARDRRPNPRLLADQFNSITEMGIQLAEGGGRPRRGCQQQHTVGLVVAIKLTWRRAQSYSA